MTQRRNSMYQNDSNSSLGNKSKRSMLRGESGTSSQYLSHLFGMSSQIDELKAKHKDNCLDTNLCSSMCNNIMFNNDDIKIIWDMQANVDSNEIKLTLKTKNKFNRQLRGFKLQISQGEGYKVLKIVPKSINFIQSDTVATQEITIIVSGEVKEPPFLFLSYGKSLLLVIEKNFKFPNAIFFVMRRFFENFNTLPNESQPGVPSQQLPLQRFNSSPIVRNRNLPNYERLLPFNDSLFHSNNNNNNNNNNLLNDRPYQIIYNNNNSNYNNNNKSKNNSTSTTTQTFNSEMHTNNNEIW